MELELYQVVLGERDVQGGLNHFTHRRFYRLKNVEDRVIITEASCTNTQGTRGHPGSGLGGLVQFIVVS